MIAQDNLRVFARDSPELLIHCLSTFCKAIALQGRLKVALDPFIKASVALCSTNIHAQIISVWGRETFFVTPPLPVIQGIHCKKSLLVFEDMM